MVFRFFLLMMKYELIQVGEPNIGSITKTVIGVDNPAAILSDPSVVSFFNQPFFVLSSTELASNNIDSDVSNLDGWDIVEFAVVVDNGGSAPAYDISFLDTIPPDMERPPGGIQLSVTTGDGTPTNYSGDPFTGGLTIDKVGKYDPFSGDNVVIVRYV